MLNLNAACLIVLRTPFGHSILFRGKQSCARRCLASNSSGSLRNLFGSNIRKPSEEENKQ